MQKKLSILLLLLTSVISIISCSNDDEPNNESSGSSSSFTINGEKIGKILNTLCKVSSREVAFEMQFNYGDEVISFEMADIRIKSISDLSKGMNLEDDIEIYKFYSFTGAFVGYERYEAIGGSIKVQSVTDKEVVLKFNNFEFIRELGNNEDTIKVNGSISYKRYD